LTQPTTPDLCSTLARVGHIDRRIEGVVFGGKAREGVVSSGGMMVFREKRWGKRDFRLRAGHRPAATEGGAGWHSVQKPPIRRFGIMRWSVKEVQPQLAFPLASDTIKYSGEAV
jgi:hypothetical protein